MTVFLLIYVLRRFWNRNPNRLVISLGNLRLYHCKIRSDPILPLPTWRNVGKMLNSTVSKIPAGGAFLLLLVHASSPFSPSDMKHHLGTDLHRRPRAAPLRAVASPSTYGNDSPRKVARERSLCWSLVTISRCLFLVGEVVMSCLLLAILWPNWQMPFLMEVTEGNRRQLH